jgi:hypothetical protein
MVTGEVVGLQSLPPCECEEGKATGRAAMALLAGSIVSLAVGGLVLLSGSSAKTTLVLTPEPPAVEARQRQRMRGMWSDAATHWHPSRGASVPIFSLSF